MFSDFHVSVEARALTTQYNTHTHTITYILDMKTFCYNITFSLCVCWSMDILVISALVVMNTGAKSICINISALFSAPLSIYPEVEFLDHMVGAL